MNLFVFFYIRLMPRYGKCSLDIDRTGSHKLNCAEPPHPLLRPKASSSCFHSWHFPFSTFLRRQFSQNDFLLYPYPLPPISISPLSCFLCVFPSNSFQNLIFHSWTRTLTDATQCGPINLIQIFAVDRCNDLNFFFFFHFKTFPTYAMSERQQQQRNHYLMYCMNIWY